jgi:hypothetical protein
VGIAIAGRSISTKLKPTKIIHLRSHPIKNFQLKPAPYLRASASIRFAKHLR